MKVKSQKDLFSKDVQQAMARLGRTDDFKVVMKYIEDCRDNKALMACGMADNTNCRWAQGEVRFADHLLVKIDEAPDMVKDS